ncbi:16S rRNA (cytosine(1402)-N(4))-methyltransferase [Candidatus Daviesbacteria bacterium RIFCSPHIGHO2_01_FULL_40_11]|uniref:Ribosomal RNA small subunit methyltransferase H n=1 Tax=Candidatus Daviesbacteria bacterium RIFCSPHIGHO2_01_FULL_40_11 TaxID=1797762 RepID=A0A1F5JGX0_9BACT|nr:MAG: 16S rRNA (cytosine(1402)-N(4))-methyltransferase [Candidatus Daviesbacteria bacterium RIFCSPHIGHO2_01_FULL_40_11]
MEGYHRSVLLREAIEVLEVRDGKWYLDCTLGDGGHTLEILRRGGKVVGIDVDPEAIERARKRLGNLGYLGNSVLIQGNFRDINNLISLSHFVRQNQTSWDKQTDTARHKFAGAIFDLGVSSLQLENPERGFSFVKKGPLDMRMDPTLQVRALDLTNTLTRRELYELFSSLGEEKYSWQVADTLVRAREVKPFKTTTELAEVVVRAVGRVRGLPADRQGKIHPATKVFQALRIAVNDELDALQEGLEEVKDLLEKNGHIVVISFHSLEDRIVKNTFKQWESMGIGEILIKKPVIASEVEVRVNPRSRSAKMRVFKKL